MKKQISLLVIGLVMVLGFSPPTFAAPDFGTENQFTIEQADLNMDIVIDVILEVTPIIDIEIFPEPVYLEGMVIMYPHFDEGYILKIDQSALTQNYVRYRHDNLSSTGTMENANSATESPETHSWQGQPLIEGPLCLEIYESYAIWRCQETYE